VDSTGGKIDVSGEDGKGFSEGNRVDANTTFEFDTLDVEASVLIFYCKGVTAKLSAVS
jgi:hypothetical protein